VDACDFTKTTSNIMKKILLMAALGSLALLGGCAKGGSGPCAANCPAIIVEPNTISTAGLNVSIALSLQFQNTSAVPVNWSITPSSCGNACGTLTNVTGSTATYVGPSSIPSNPQISVVATSQNDSSLSGSLDLTIIADIANVAPPSGNVGIGLTQQFTAVVLPDQAPQTVTWTCSASGVQCANFTPAANNAGTAQYTPTASEQCSGCVIISANPTIDPTGCQVGSCTSAKISAVASRVPTGTYAFQFSGYDANGKAILVAGTFTVASNGSISGYEDEWTASGLARRSFSNGSYAPLSGSNANSNNAGTLSLNTGAFPSDFDVVLDSAGDIQMIASGSGANGSGVAEPSSTNKFNQGTNATFAFGLTGVDSSNHRVGYVGLLPTDGTSNVTAGLIDVNDNASSSNAVCSASSAPCAVSGTYVPDGTVNNLWHLTLTSPTTMTFDFFVANGNTNSNTPLTLYAISTDTNPAVVGTMTLQDSKVAPYDNKAFSGTSVSALTGVNGNSALILATTYGDSGGSGVSGACPGSSLGSVTGTFDQNNAGTITSIANFPSAAQSTNPYTYVSTAGNTGRYIFCLLGNPSANPVVLPIPFVAYASGANRGYLLDQSSAAVMTGTMSVQVPPKQNKGFFANSTAAGTYAVATSSNTASTCSSLTSCWTWMNLLLTSPGNSTFNVTGVEDGSTAVNLTYNIQSDGYGSFGPISPNKTPNYVLYGVTETDFFVMDVDPGVTSPILYMAQ
jgi:hypothetical protein